MSVIIETTLGDITVDLFVEERPRCCLNFLKLCKVKYYNYCLFHNVQRNFIAQTGDPTGSGRGGESIFRLIYGDQAKFFDAEKLPKIKHTSPGLISMVNDGNGFHGSQFLITLGENLDSLDDVHTVFGEVAEGMEVAMKINEAFCDKENRPFQDVRITHTVVLDDPLDDPPGLEIPDRSPEPTKEQIEGSFRIGADEVINDDEGIDEEELKEREEKKEAKHSAQVLEIIGDIPDVDVKPPDNVLFVCKLNSITTDEDLEIIFARFGTIVSCEIIRDYKTGDSLQYAFIEFESADSCEKAYKKMDNVLIDDRRIHVDFSQSVSKINFPQGRVTKADLEGNKPNNDPKHNSSQFKPKTDQLPPSRQSRRDHSPRHRRDVTPPVRYHQDRDVTHSRRERSRENERRRHNDDITRRMESRHDVSTNRRRERSPRKKSRRDVTPPRHDRRHRDESDNKSRRKNDRSTNEKRHRRDATTPSSGDDTIVESRNNKRRDVTPPRKKQKRSDAESPSSARRQRQDGSSSSGGDSEEERSAKKKLKKQRKKEAKKLSKKKKKSSTSDSDVSSSGEEEVRCGKHRKRSVHKDDVIRRKSHKHRS